MVRTGVVRAVGLAAVLAAVGSGRASLLSPDEPPAVPVRLDGTGEPLAFDEFRQRYAAVTNMADEKNNPEDRRRLLRRIADRTRDPKPTPDAVVALAADLIRAGRADEALNRLKPLYDDRDRRGTRTYAVTAALVHAHAARGEWDHALNYLPDLFGETPPPVRGLTAEQRAWQARLDQDYLPHYLRLRRAEADPAARPNPETEDPTPLFPLPAGGRPADPVRWVNDAGVYEPGTLAATERAKLPPDAVAVVQQLLLWFPSDVRLYWLLAELYAADGRLADAQSILDEAAWSRQYGNRTRLMDHRAAVTAEAEARRPKPPDVPISLRTVLVYFGAVAALAAVAFARALTRRTRGNAPRLG